MNNTNKSDSKDELTNDVAQPVPEGEYIPCMMTAYPPHTLGLMFDGPLPKVGDAVEMVCYKATDTALCFKWRVVEHNAKSNPRD